MVGFVPVQNLEITEAQLRAELDRALEHVEETKAKGEDDKEALKKAVRAQKERAERSEEYVQKLTAQLAEKVPAETRQALFEVVLFNCCLLVAALGRVSSFD